MVFHTLEWMWRICREAHGVLERSQALKAVTRHPAFEICKLGWDSDLKTLCRCLEKHKWYIYLTALSGGEDNVCRILGSCKGLKIGDAYYAGGPDDYNGWSLSTGSHSFTLTVSQEMKPYAYKLSNNQAKGSGYVGRWKELGFLGMEDIFLPPGGSFSICTTAQKTWLRKLSIILEEELKIFDFIEWLKYYFCLAWLISFLHFLTSLLKFILWLKFGSSACKESACNAGSLQY